MEELYVDAAKEIAKLVVARPLEQMKLAWELKRQLEKLKEEFTYIQAFLHDVSRSNHHTSNNTNNRGEASNSQIVNAWLRRVMDLAYFADDVMDDYAFETLHKRSSKVLANFVELKRISLFKKLCSGGVSDNNVSVPSSDAISFKMWKLVAFRFRISSKVEGILRSFDNLYKDAAKLGIRPVEMSATTVRGRVHFRGDDLGTNIHESLDEVRELAVTHSFEFVGRQPDQDELTKLLCFPNNDEEISTIVIVGMGGLGKTTLARQLYSNASVMEHFTERFWICVSDNFTVKRILREMFEKLTGGKCELSNTEDIIHRVQQFLRGKRYLLVLDDVWHQNHTRWNSFRNCLLRMGGATGCTILVTTRSKDTARTVESRYTHELTGLTDEECWTFFVQKAFPKGISEYNPGFAEIGRKIVKKCDGLPLAISVIGGLLRMKEKLSEWKTVERSRLWDLPQENNDIIPSLLLSFNNLSSPALKQCFAYCAFFPNDAVIDREDLINLWNAQGFLNCQPEGIRMTPEELGGMYFDILLNNSLLQAETRHSFDGNVVVYHMHYLVHDLALYVSRHDWLIWKGVDDISDHPDCRHLAIFPGHGGLAPDLPVEKMRRLRTLQSLIKIPKDLVIHTTNLRVLKLVGIGLEEVPPAIVRYKHLRYLDLSHNSLVTLPDSITRLYHLQTFRLLSHKLKELPASFCRLVNLRHLYLTFRSWFLPRGIQYLTALQTLPMLELMKDQGCRIGELSCLSDIKGLLSISGLEQVKSKAEAEMAGICRKHNISELQLIWGRSGVDNHFDVLDALQPHLNIKLLMITGYDSPNFPSWMMSMMTLSEVGNFTAFYNLVQIELLYCESCQQLPALGHLPRLKNLSMYSLCSVEYMGSEFYHSANNLPPILFPALTTLNISSFETLKEWALPAGRTTAFPMLETLRIEYCQELIQTPTNFHSLKNLRINNSLNGLALCNLISGSNNALTSLDINEAPELVVLPDDLTDCTSLEELKLRCCPKLQSLPESLGCRLSALYRFSIVKCPQLIKIPASIGECQSLKKLCISNCHNLESIPDLCQLVHLEEIEITGCQKLSCLPGVRHFLSSTHCPLEGLSPSISSSRPQNLRLISSSLA